MAESHDTEITLGTGKVLFLFFGLVALCAAFFGMGFKMGKILPRRLCPATRRPLQPWLEAPDLRPSNPRPAPVQQLQPI